jgi:quercetin dioxygenase-like cupin family protein
MKVISSYLEVKPKEEVPGAAMREVITGDDGAPNFTMRVFEVKPGSKTPTHAHSWEHEVFVLSGRGVVKGEHGETEIGNGSVVFIPPDEKHCFVTEGSEPLRFVCLIPLSGVCSVA